jgi:peptide/nickel transport system permease protein
MRRKYQTTSHSIINKIYTLGKRGFWGMSFGSIILLLLLAGMLYSWSYEKRFGPGYVGVNDRYHPPQIAIFNRVLNRQTDGPSESLPRDEENSSQKPKVNHDAAAIAYKDEFTSKEEIPLSLDRGNASFKHPLGSDGDGRDILRSLLLGCRVVLFSGVMVIGITLLLGTSLGIFSGYLSQEPISRFLRNVFPFLRKKRQGHAFSLYWGDLVNFLPTVVNIFPRLVLIIIILSLWKKIDIWSVVIAIGIINVPKVSFLIKDKIENLKNQEFIEAAREIGASHPRIILKHILWYNCRPILLVQTGFILAEVILLESTLGYLGYGLSDSWGHMVALEKDLIFQANGIYWPIFFPVGVIVLTILAFQSLGDGLNRYLEIER